MPNWSENNVLFDNKESFLTFKKALVDKDGNVDFNLLIPKPETLEITSGSVNDDIFASKNYVDFCHQNDNKSGHYFEESFAGYKKGDKLFNVNAARYEQKLLHDAKTPQEFYEGIKLTQSFNMKHYGFKDWYEWCYHNWDTKWNAAYSNVDDWGLTICFSTANGAAENIFKTFFKAHPECQASVVSAVEGYGIYIYRYNGSNFTVDGTVKYYQEGGYDGMDVVEGATDYRDENTEEMEA